LKCNFHLPLCCTYPKRKIFGSEKVLSTGDFLYEKLKFWCQTIAEKFWYRVDVMQTSFAIDTKKM